MSPQTISREEDITENTGEIRELAERFSENVGKVIVGKSETIELLLVALLCEGNVLLEDVPGMGKTVMAKAAARSVGCSFRRIQCTPDLLPSDVTGLQFYNQQSGCFEFRPGPLLANIVLVDEINRATPRTQSALLEAMQEQQVTVDLETVPLPRPFMLLATQNPIELEGTFPLPEAQLDRFLLKLRIGYPTAAQEGEILSRFETSDPLADLTAVIDAAHLLGLQAACRRVRVDDSVRNYAVALVRATREHPHIKLGASPRAALGLHRTAQAFAAMRGRDYVTPDDVKYLAVPALAHRLIVKTEARLRGHTAEETVGSLLDSVPVPVEEA